MAHIQQWHVLSPVLRVPFTQEVQHNMGIKDYLLFNLTLSYKEKQKLKIEDFRKF